MAIWTLMQGLDLAQACMSLLMHQECMAKGHVEIILK